MVWENKYKKYYERICNDIFARIYPVLFGEEAPCLSLEGKNIVKEYGDLHMTPDGVYIRISSRTKAPHWLPHFVPDTLLLQKIAYQTYVNGLVASLHKLKRVFSLLFPYQREFTKLENLSMPKR